MISVLMALYNGERYVIEQLESIRTQTLPVDEVILADDGSTDGTVSLVQNYIAEHSLNGWSVTRNAVNLGPAGNCLALLGRASGDFVFLADQDDVWEPHKVATVLEHFERHNEVVAVASTEVLIDRHGDAITDPKMLRGFGRTVTRFPGWVTLSVDDFAGNSHIPWHSTCIRREVIESALSAGTPAVGRTLGADWYVGLVACLLGGFHLLGTPLVRWRIHDSNASLGRLRRSSLLGTNRERRISLIEEVAEAHRFVLRSGRLAAFLRPRDRRSLEDVVELQANRARFTRRPTPLMFLALVRMLGVYRVSFGNWKAAFRGLGADILYASPLGRKGKLG